MARRKVAATIAYSPVYSFAVVGPVPVVTSPYDGALVTTSFPVFTWNLTPYSTTVAWALVSKGCEAFNAFGDLTSNDACWNASYTKIYGSPTFLYETSPDINTVFSQVVGKNFPDGEYSWQVTSYEMYRGGAWRSPVQTLTVNAAYAKLWSAKAKVANNRRSMNLTVNSQSSQPLVKYQVTVKLGKKSIGKVNHYALNNSKTPGVRVNKALKVPVVMQKGKKYTVTVKMISGKIVRTKSIVVRG
jgi:hypothetical protein